MRLLKSVFLASALCAFTVTSFAQNEPKGPAGFAKKIELQSRGAQATYDASPGRYNQPGSNAGCSTERKAIEVKDELIAELKKQIQDLERTGSPVAKKGAGK